MKNGYIVKASPRAKYARLKMSIREGLVIVVPKGFDQGRIPGLLEKKKRWIEQASEQIELRRKFLEPELSGALPERMALQGIGEEWAVNYISTNLPHVTITECHNKQLHVFGNTDSKDSCRAVLRQWLNRKTHEHIKTWLVKMAEERKFKLNRVLVKSQRTRWASCSRRKTISLNLKLLFIPADLIRYVLIHELCHTEHLNHSNAFWALLKHHEPDYAKKKYSLRAAEHFVPSWLDANKISGG